jgi:Concanavalin A-like lectin/glucanases superfamily
MSKYVGNIVTAGVPTGYSVSFDGNGDYLQIASPSNIIVDWTTTNFTLEYWVYPTAFGSGANSQSNVVGNANATGSSEYWSFGPVSGGTVRWYYWTGSPNSFSTTTTLALNTWSHIAFVNNANSLTIYINGVSSATATKSGTPLFGSDVQFNIGQCAGSSFNGYVSNIRIVKSAVYTANFTPPTQLFAITNTSLLTCQQPTIIDTSSNNFTITVNGNAAVSTLSPYPAYQAYNPALGGATNGIWNLNEAAYAAQNRSWNMYDPYFDYVTLLLNGDNAANGAQNNTFLDSSTNNFTITRNGNTTQGSFSPYGPNWSNYFDGTGDYLSTANATALSLGSGDFTVEAWIYPDRVLNTYNNIIGGNVRYQSSVEYGWYVSLDGTGKPTIVLNGTTYAAFTLKSSTSLNVSKWYHFAVSRSGTSINMYIDGVQVASGTSSVNENYVSNSFYIGTGYVDFLGGAGVATLSFQGNVSNFRLVKGTALYTSNFTPSTTPLTAVSGTSLLTCQSNRFRDNSSNNFAITVNGNTSVQRFSPFNPTAPYSTSTIGGSGYFDGTGDYLALTATGQSLSSGSWTIEGWVYFNSFTATAPHIFNFGTDAVNRYSLLREPSGGKFVFVTANSSTFVNATGTTTALLNTWYHFAVVSDGTTRRLYINGVQEASSTSAINSGTNWALGFMQFGTASGDYLNGYISNFRIVKGTAVYTSAFTPPTAPLTAITDTSLLLNMTNAGIPDAAMMNDLETVGNAQVSTSVKKYGTGSLYFDGSGDWLTFNSSDLLSFGTGNFTVEFWMYPTAITAQMNVIATGGSFATNSARIGKDLSLGMALYSNNGTGVIVSEGSNTYISGAANKWTYYAFVRNGNSFTLYRDGTSVGTGTSSGAVTLSLSGSTVIGTDWANNYFNGYIDDFRITKGYARYTSNFTPPTSALQTL